MGFAVRKDPPWIRLVLPQAVVVAVAPWIHALAPGWVCRVRVSSCDCVCYSGVRALALVE